jgi:hypothetical protein
MDTHANIGKLANKWRGKNGCIKMEDTIVMSGTKGGKMTTRGMSCDDAVTGYSQKKVQK